MVADIQNFLVSPAWEIIGGALLIWGCLAIGYLLLGGVRSWRSALFVWGGIGLLTASVVVSMVFESIVPMTGTQPPHEVAMASIGLVGILAAVAMLIYGAVKFVRATFGVMAQYRVGRTRSRRVRSRTKQAGTDAPMPGPAGRTAELMQSWGPGAAWIGSGIVLLFFFASMQNENRFPMAWFWSWFGLVPTL